MYISVVVNQQKYGVDLIVDYFGLFLLDESWLFDFNQVVVIK